MRLQQPPPPTPPPDNPYGIPTPAPKAPPGLETFGDDVVSWLKYAGVVSVLIGLLICAIMMALGRRNRSEMAAQGMMGIPWVIAAALLIAGVTGIVTGLLKSG